MKAAIAVIPGSMADSLLVRFAGWACVCVLAVAGFARPAQGQFPDPLPDPDIDLRVAGNVLAMARQPDGGVVFGGNFSAVDGQQRASIARLNADGSLDMAWNPGANGTVAALVADAVGTIYVGGNFTFIGSAPRARLAKLSGFGEGTVDPAWAPAANASVNSLALDGNGSLFIGGVFSNINEQAQSRLARVSATGAGLLDVAWSPGADGSVDALAWSQGALFVGGVFGEIGGLPRLAIAKIAASGVVDPDWNPGSGGSVLALLPGAGSTIYAGGNFMSIGGQASVRVARLSTAGTGSADPQWNPSANGAVSALLLRNDTLYIGGGFTAVNGVARRSLAGISIQAGANVDAAFNPGADASVRALANLGAADIAAGGLFTRAGGELRLAVARLGADGSVAVAIDAETIGRVDSLLPLPDGNVIVGGYFQKANGLARSHLLKLRPDGTIDPLWSPSTNATVVAMARASDGALFAGGYFTRVDDQPRAYLAKLDASGVGELDPDWRPVANGAVLAMVVSSNALFVGGEFGRIDNVLRVRLAKLASDATLDPDWNPGANAPIHTLAAASGQVYAGGDFTQIDGVSRNRVARLSAAGTGTVDPVWSPGTDARVTDLVIDGAGRVYVAGAFTAIAGAAQPALARLVGATAMLDPTWNPRVNDGSVIQGHVVRGIALSGQHLYVGGRFAAIGDLAVSNMARLSLIDALADPEWVPLADGNVHAISVATTGRPVVGGDFIAVNDQPRRSLAMFERDDTIFADGFE